VYGNLSPGLLLASVGRDGKRNVMTIGWGLVGVLFRKPVFMAAVRRSRHTYRLLNETGVFTVNVPGPDMAEAVDFCGTESGRDHDKFRELGLTARSGTAVEAPIVDECTIHLECRVAATTDVTKGATSEGVLASVYPSGDYHRLYHGEILRVYRDA